MKRLATLRAALSSTGIVVIFVALALSQSGCNRAESESADASPDSNSPSNNPPETVVELSDGQLNAIKIGTAGTYAFPIQKEGIGTIDFENRLYSDPSLSTQIFPPREGAIARMFVELGDEVQKGQPLYSLAASGTNQSETMVRSPLSGQVTAVNLTAGLWAQPSNAPAPCAVANVSTKWLLANVTESDSTAFQIGQPVDVTVVACPGRVFHGKITKIYATLDLNTHRLTLRADISDPNNELRAGMLADFVAQVHSPVESVALPANGVVREGDGTMTAWVTLDRRHFIQRVVKTGLREDGEVQILEGLQPGELVVTDGALFLDNMLQAPVDD